MSFNQVCELLLKNKDEIALIIEKKKQRKLSLISFIQGYHAYMEIWTPKVGDDSLYLKCEDENKHDKYAVALVIRGKTLDLHRKT